MRALDGHVDINDDLTNRPTKPGTAYYKQSLYKIGAHGFIFRRSYDGDWLRASFSSDEVPAALKWALAEASHS